ncbi:MAG: T9SS type A sorting domain-containing protein [Lewinellaceae bacterium]|nr:T9SS type A sorting domain-containing protein [Saprospiraceae bacterium]MCB9338216.1 T9SS type A sorting domain-containing protein [Lewinellaceae bacterium]
MNSLFCRLFAFFCLCSLALNEATGQCTSYAGTMSGLPYQVCGQNVVTVPATIGAVVDPDDVLQYALHTNAGSSLGTIISLNSTPTFSFVPPMGYGTAYYISAIVGNDDGSGNVDQNDPCLSVAAGTSVTFYGGLPTATLSGGGTICQGEIAALTINLTGESPWQVELQLNGSLQPPITVFNNPFSYSVTAPGVYSLGIVVDVNGCTGTTSGSAVVTAVAAPLISNIMVDCGPNNADYTVMFTILGGDPASYSVNPPLGNLSGNVFTSIPFPSGIGYSFEVDDANGCGPTQVAGPAVICDCATQVGTMDPTPIQINDCNQGPAVAIYDNTNEVLDPNDNLGFVLHTNPGVALGTILQTNTLPEFTFDPATMTYGTTYYISALVGNDDGQGGVSILDPCLDVAAGTPVIFNAVPLTISIAPLLFCPGEPIAISILAAGGNPPYTYLWTGPNGWTSTDPNPVLPQVSGIYTVTVTDANLCSTTANFTLAIPTPIVCDLQTDGELSCANPEVNLSFSCTGGVPPYSYQWSNGIFGPNGTLTQPGTYSITIVDANGCSSVESVDVTVSQDECGLIRGKVVEDIDGACLFDAGDQPLGNWMVKATDGSNDFFGLTNADGEYEIFVLPGTYEVEVILPPNGYWASCQAPITAVLVDATDVDTADFALDKLVDCPLLEVDISTPFLRRCFSNNYYVNYCNLGTTAAADAYIEINFDPFILVTGASIPFSGPVNNVYTFEIGDISVGECGNFTIQSTTSCAAALGQTLCAEAHIFPDTICSPPSPTWSGATIQITSECTADSIIFSLQNIGTGDMTAPSNFIVVEDGVMLMNGPQDFQLQTGETLSFSFPANGSTYVLWAEQVAGNPGLSSPLVAVEGCGTNNLGTFSTGFVTQFPENDADPFLSIDCHEVIGSYDPNDKNGFPKGYGEEHLIEAGQELDYHIRFQNTGTDTAFKVVVQDVIAPELDLSTLRPGAANHPYQLDIHNDTLVFIFENILLPDSNVNEPGSHGFVKFRIGQKAGLPLGTTIENEAAIYFDFNDPVVTNTTVHKLGDHFITTPSREVSLPSISWSVFPNPFSDEATFLVTGAEFQAVELSLYDLTGRFIQQQKVVGGMAKVKKGSLSPGLYFYKITVEGVMAGQGKLAVE